MPAIFISHSSQDNAHAAEIRDWLADLGFEQVFLDFDKASGIGAGKDWERELYEAIERCQAVIALITPAWLASKWCFAEVANARSQGKPVFPIVSTADDVRLIGPELQNIQAELWNPDGQKHLGDRLKEIAAEIARGYRFDRSRQPWPGILTYEADDAATFFGRDPEIRRLSELLDARRVQGGARLVLIVGASGSGKSSLLRAGLLPYLGRDHRNWAILPPLRPGTAPLAQLAKALAETLKRPADWQEIEASLRHDPTKTLRALFEETRVGPAREATVLVPIDQFEELTSLAEPDEQKAMMAVLRALADRAASLPALVVGTIRSDLLGAILKIDGFDIAREIFTLGPMPHDRLRAIIEGPARIADIHLEAGLTERILADAGAPEALPLLAFALRELNERYGADKRLQIVEYEALGDPAAGLSPLENAIRRKAEDAFAAAAPSQSETRALREAFLGSLTRISDDGARMKRPAPVADLPAAAGPLIRQLTEARLLTVSDEGNQRTVEVTHDALFTAWPQLKAWLDDEQDFLHARRQIEEARRMWDAAPPAEKPKALLSGLLLARARDWQRHTPERLAPVADFVTASIRRHSTVRRRQVLAGLGAAAAVGVAGTLGARTLRELAAYQQARAKDRNRTDLTGDLIVYSTSPGGAAYEFADQRNGTFTGALLPALADPRLSVAGALAASVQATLDGTDGRQRPELVTNVNGDLYLSDAPADRRTAVVSVGVNTYPGMTLGKSVFDASDIAALFRKFGYAPDLLTDCPLADFVAAVKRAGQSLAPQTGSWQAPHGAYLQPAGLRIEPGPGDASPSPVAPPTIAPPARPADNTVFFLFFSGLGFAQDGDTYISLADTPSDANVTREEALSGSISIREILEYTRPLAAVRILVVDTNRTPLGGPAESRS